MFIDIEIALHRSLLMKTILPHASEDVFTLHDNKIAPEGLIQMFLEKEENARRLETKTGKINSPLCIINIGVLFIFI